jgi:hypothetical protein
LRKGGSSAALITAHHRGVTQAIFSERARRRLSTGYGLAALGLVPWIVLLFLTQAHSGEARDLVTVSIGVPVMVIIGLLTTVGLYAAGSAFAAMSATFTAAAAFIMSWFRYLTQTFEITGRSLVVLAVIVLMIGFLGWVAAGASRWQGAAPRHRWVPVVPVVLVVAALLLTVSLFRIAALTPNHHEARHLRLVWTGLDVFEVIGLAGTCLALRARAPRVTMVAAYTAALLLCDAWFNVLASHGAGQAEAIALAAVEVPIAVLSLVVAYDSAADGVT